MSPPNEEPAPTTGAGSQTFGFTTDSPQASSLTQLDRVRLQLQRGWICASQFLDQHIPRYGARIHELKRQGYSIERRLCAHPWHNHRSTQYQWRIVGEPGKPAPLPGMGDA